MTRKRLTIIVGLLFLLGSLLVINEQLKNMLIIQMTRSGITKATKSRDRRRHLGAPNFNFSRVKPANWENTLKAWQSNTTEIGEIVIPSVQIKLPIYYGLNNENLLKGVGTMRAHDRMGKGNYALAGHHMENPKILFSPLTRVQRGQRVYLTDNKRLYVYRIQSKRIISKYQVGYLKTRHHRRTLTLLTCLTANVGETRQILVTGSFSYQTRLNQRWFDLFR